MNILFIAYNFTPYFGGVQRVTDILTKELQKQGHKVYYLCGCDQSHGENKCLAAPIYFMDKPMEVNLDNQSLKLYHRYLLELQIEVVIHQFPILQRSLFFLRNTPEHIVKISTIHIQPFYYVGHEKELIRNITVSSFTSRIKKFILSLKPSLFSKIYLKREIPIYQDIVKYSDKLCLLSEKFIPRIYSICPNIDVSKITAIGNPNTFEPSKFGTKEKMILYVGRIAFSPKNIKDFVDIWRILYKKNPEWKACIVGDGPDMPYLKEYISKHSIERLTLAGAQSDVKPYYEKANFICMVSAYEGWGMTLTEGMTYGCIPCAYNSYESITDIIENEKDGIITPAMDVQFMATKIQEIINSPNKMQIMSENAINKVQNFSAHQIAQKWINLINIINNKKNEKYD